MTNNDRFTFLLVGLLVLTLSACGGGKKDEPAVAKAPQTSAKAAGGGGSGAPVTITTVAAVSRDMPVIFKATGTVVPLNSVEVKSQVTSVVVKVHVREGQFVKAGDLLFTLDARTDEANAAKARAQLAKDQAAMADAKRQLDRAQQLQIMYKRSIGNVFAPELIVVKEVAVQALNKLAQR